MYTCIQRDEGNACYPTPYTMVGSYLPTYTVLPELLHWGSYWVFHLDLPVHSVHSSGPVCLSACLPSACLKKVPLQVTQPLKSAHSGQHVVHHRSFNHLHFLWRQ